MFCKRGSPLHKELQAAWRLYIAADEDTLDKYQDLFSKPHRPDMEFVTFQQVVLRDKVASATEEELAAIEEFINTRLEEKKDQDERPWNMLKVDDSQPEIDLQRQYIEEYVCTLFIE